MLLQAHKRGNMGVTDLNCVPTGVTWCALLDLGRGYGGLRYISGPLFTIRLHARTLYERRMAGSDMDRCCFDNTC